MNVGRMIYMIEAAATEQECKTGARPDAIVVSMVIYRELMGSFLVTCHQVEEPEKIKAEERLCGMVLECNPYMKGSDFIPGNRYDIDKLDEYWRARYEQVHDYWKPGAGSGDGDD